MVSLPIPEARSPIRYQDICWQGDHLGKLVFDLSGGRIAADAHAHLDPDLNAESLARSPHWRPVFGQTSASQGHLHNQHVQPGDLFLFFGLFRSVELVSGKVTWKKDAPRQHVIWGWLQAAEIHKVDSCGPAIRAWANYHPHFQRELDGNNTLYIARQTLELEGEELAGWPGAGVFGRCVRQRTLTAPGSDSPCRWALPGWCLPRNGTTPLTYHAQPWRWKKEGAHARLQSVSRGQEFILDGSDYPEALDWLRSLFS